MAVRFCSDAKETAKLIVGCSAVADSDVGKGFANQQPLYKAAVKGIDQDGVTPANIFDDRRVNRYCRVRSHLETQKHGLRNQISFELSQQALPKAHENLGPPPAVQDLSHFPAATPAAGSAPLTPRPPAPASAWGCAAAGSGVGGAAAQLFSKNQGKAVGCGGARPTIPSAGAIQAHPQQGGIAKAVPKAKTNNVAAPPGGSGGGALPLIAPKAGVIAANPAQPQCGAPKLKAQAKSVAVGGPGGALPLLIPSAGAVQQANVEQGGAPKAKWGGPATGTLPPIGNAGMVLQPHAPMANAQLGGVPKAEAQAKNQAGGGCKAKGAGAGKPVTQGNGKATYHGGGVGKGAGAVKGGAHQQTSSNNKATAGAGAGKGGKAKGKGVGADPMPAKGKGGQQTNGKYGKKGQAKGKK
eukprot:g13123.t1